MLTTLSIIAVVMIITATFMEIIWGRSKKLGYNTGCLVVFLGLRFAKKWMSILYQTLLLGSTITIMVFFILLFCSMKLNFIQIVLAIIATLFSIFLPIILLVFLHLFITMSIIIIAYLYEVVFHR